MLKLPALRVALSLAAGVLACAALGLPACAALTQSAAHLAAEYPRGESGTFTTRYVPDPQNPGTLKPDPAAPGGVFDAVITTGSRKNRGFIAHAGVNRQLPAAPPPPPPPPTDAGREGATPISTTVTPQAVTPQTVTPSTLSRSLWWRYLRGRWPMQQGGNVVVASESTVIVLAGGVDADGWIREWVVVVPKESATASPTKLTATVAGTAVTVAFDSTTIPNWNGGTADERAAKSYVLEVQRDATGAKVSPDNTTGPRPQFRQLTLPADQDTITWLAEILKYADTNGLVDALPEP